MSIAEVVLSLLWVLLAAAGGWFAFRMALQNGRLLLRIESLETLLLSGPGGVGLPAGSKIPDFSLPLLSGGVMGSSQWKGRSFLLIFTRPGCANSEKLLQQMNGALPQLESRGLPPVIVSIGEQEDNCRFFEKRPVACPVLSDEDGEVARSYGVAVTPMAFMVDRRGGTLRNALVGAGAILELLGAEKPANQGAAVSTDSSPLAGSLTRSKLVRDGLKAGTPAPEFRLPTLEEGSEISLGQMRGRPLLLVFSAPDCAPCQELAPQLEKLHRSSDLQILMISRGGREVNRQKAGLHGLTFPVALQAHWEVSKAYGTFATPSGYLIDEHGVLMTDLTIGVDDILKLARSPRAGNEQTSAELRIPAGISS